jgi:uroporphyrinogen-III synthase
VTCVLSDIARTELTDLLAAAGAELTVFTGYRNSPVTDIPDDLRDEIASGQFEAVTFASSSSVAAFLDLVGIDLPALSGAAMLAIGPTTADAMRQHGLPVHAMAVESTVPGLIAALASYFGGDHLEEQP